MISSAVKKTKSSLSGAGKFELWQKAKVLNKTKKVKNEIESRFKNEYENGEPLYQSISQIEAKLKKYFTLIEIRNIEIMW